jgi:hypothetical protein
VPEEGLEPRHADYDSAPSVAALCGCWAFCLHIGDFSPAIRLIEVLGQVDEELATGAGSAGLDEAQVLGRDVGVQGQLELAEATSPAPKADQLARGLGLLLGLGDHPIDVSGASAQVPLPDV